MVVQDKQENQEKQWLPVGTYVLGNSVPDYQVYQEDQDQISGATYISDVVFSVTRRSRTDVVH